MIRWRWLTHIIDSTTVVQCDELWKQTSTSKMSLRALSSRLHYPQRLDLLQAQGPIIRRNMRFWMSSCWRVWIVCIMVVMCVVVVCTCRAYVYLFVTAMWFVWSYMLPSQTTHHPNHWLTPFRWRDIFIFRSTQKFEAIMAGSTMRKLRRHLTDVLRKRETW